jgi:hypothetical protein
MRSAATFHSRERHHDARIVSRTPARADQLTGQDVFPGLGQPGVLCHLGPGDCSARHTSPACHDRCRGSAESAEALEVCVAPLPLAAAGPGDLARGRAGHRRPQPGARHCERHEHGPDNDWAGACAPPVAPDSWPPSVAEARRVSCTLRLHLKTSNLFPESNGAFIAAGRAGQATSSSRGTTAQPLPGPGAPAECRGPFASGIRTSRPCWLNSVRRAKFR